MLGDNFRHGQVHPHPLETPETPDKGLDRLRVALAAALAASPAAAPRLHLPGDDEDRRVGGRGGRRGRRRRQEEEELRAL